MSDKIISAREAYQRTHKNISRAFEKINRSIESAIAEGRFSCSVYLTDAEYAIALPHLDHRVMKMERSGSMSFHYILDWSEEPPN